MRENFKIGIILVPRFPQKYIESTQLCLARMQVAFLLEELLKIKEQELARLAQIKELLQQKLAEETNRANVLQKELELTKAQTNSGSPQLQAELAQIRAEIGQVTGKLPKIEEKVDQILTNLQQFLSKVRVASKMAKSSAAEGQPVATPETKEPASSRPLKPSDLIRPASESSEGDAGNPAPGTLNAKPSEVLKRHQVQEETETAAKQDAIAAKSDKAKKSRAKVTTESAVEAPAGDSSEAEEAGEKKGKEGEMPSAGIITVPYPSDGSIICPKCNKQNYQEMQDPTNVVAYAPVKKFGRKFYCKSCRCNWRYKM